MVDLGFFAKVVADAPAGMELPNVREICSVSECISAGPPNWIEHWLHNGLGLFNRESDALEVVPLEDRSAYRLFAYRSYPEIFRNECRIELEPPDDVHPEVISAQFSSLGFDVVSKSTEYASGFECSPLSCNGLAGEIVVNGYCLIADLEEAIAVAARFALEQPEPGDYYVMEVLEKRLIVQP